MQAGQARLGHYFLATFGWSWAWWAMAVPMFRIHGLADAPWWAYILLLVGSYGPTLMALVFTARQGGRQDVRALVRRLKPRRGAGSWLLVALLLPSALSLGGMALYRLGGESLGAIGFGRAYLLPIALLAAVPFGPLAEELGWRGYALPRLRARWGPLASSVIIGVAWAFWHIPLFWAPAGTSISGAPVTASAVLFYVALLVGLSVAFTWIHDNTGGNVLLAVVLHTSFNAEAIFLFLPDLGSDPRRTIERLSLVPLAFLAAGLAVRWRTARRTSP